MGNLIAGWCAADARMSSICSAVPGIRILRQPPFETLISFICSSNNNISRIGQMLGKLRMKYGLLLGTADVGSIDTFYAFPTVEALASAPEETLRGLGVGYRASYIQRTAQSLMEKGGDRYLLGLRGQPREEVQEALCAFPGVGRKVADCVALFSLDQPDIVPVDTHVWTIAVRDMDPTLAEAPSLTPKVYDRVGNLFRGRYVGGYAGWAHSVLFTAELPRFSAALPPDLRAEMESFRIEERAAKAEKREAKAARKRQGPTQHEDKPVNKRKKVAVLAPSP